MDRSYDFSGNQVRVSHQDAKWQSRLNPLQNISTHIDSFPGFSQRLKVKAAKMHAGDAAIKSPASILATTIPNSATSPKTA
jgi:hypothetical protein